MSSLPWLLLSLLISVALGILGHGLEATHERRVRAEVNQAMAIAAQWQASADAAQDSLRQHIATTPTPPTPADAQKRGQLNFHANRLSAKAKDASDLAARLYRPWPHRMTWKILTCLPVVAMGSGFAVSVILRRRTRGARRSGDRCKGCGNVLRGAPSRCPECGVFQS